ncbi:MAG TPA: hypothetical protein VH251_08755 [Verrucomicrobiae bacterium]|nr:hypothetical protein [Verrucomicrobiae bacterium]
MVLRVSFLSSVSSWFTPLYGPSIRSNPNETMRYRGYEALTDESDLLLHFQNAELELRRVIQSQTWTEMRAQPGVTNLVPFKLMSADLADYARSYPLAVNLVVYYAAVSEARRRILVTAIALERYRGKHGAYPVALTALSPEFLKVVPVDFMDGQPLRYHLTDDSHFVLYSVGLDCVDDSGKMPLPDAQRLPQGKNRYPIAPTNVDIVWP